MLGGSTLGQLRLVGPSQQAFTPTIKAIPVVIVTSGPAVYTGATTPRTMVAPGPDVYPGPATPIMVVVGRPVLAGPPTPMMVVARPVHPGKAIPVA